MATTAPLPRSSTTPASRTTRVWLADPTVSWQIGLGVEFEPGASLPGVGEIEARLAAVAARHDWPAPARVTAHPDLDSRQLWERAITRTDDAPLVVLCGRDAWAIFAHHLYIDGLGLLSALAVALDATVTCRVRGVGDRPVAPRKQRYVAMLAPLVAALRPGVRRPRSTPELVRRDIAARVRPTDLVQAALAPLGPRATSVGLAVSKRPGTVLGVDQVDDQSALIRLERADLTSADTIRAAIETAPLSASPVLLLDPARPPSLKARILMALSRTLLPRGGVHVLVSHVGTVGVDAPVTGLTLHPSVGGRHALAVGAIAVETPGGTRTSLVVRSSREREPGWTARYADALTAALTP